MGTIDTETLYLAFSTRDPRHDGRFYVGVTTTGIYCRPTCPARPKQENIRFFRSKAEAEKAGFRPCLRCRPDLSPTSIQWQGTAAVIARAFGMINRGEADGSKLSGLAERLGMTDRHLRRLFQQHLGASPLEVAISRRLHLARQLLSQTPLSITDIALASGFGSLRRFNDAFLTTYRRNPSEFRKLAAGAPVAADSITLRVPYIERYDWENLLRYFARHEVYGVDAVDGNCYLRHLKTTGGESLVRVEHLERSHCLQVSLTMSDFSEIRQLIDTVRCVFDVDHNPLQIELPAECAEELQAVLQCGEGIRVPGAFDPLETAISVILGQLVSTAQGRLNLRKLVERYGERSRVPHHPRLSHFFPTAAVLASEDLTSLGFTKVRANAIRLIAAACLDGTLDLSRTCDLGRTRKALLDIKGIGPWTVEMIALRCLGDTDAFPASDLVINRALEKFRLFPEQFSPWRSYLALAIWKTQAAALSGEPARQLAVNTNQALPQRSKR
jgi:AraC family transcriptional regulator, regulatory protein of adaptative response / DNA-3-methyladenine glycosylase II